VENYKDYHHQQLQQQQNYRLDKDMLMDKTKSKSEYQLRGTMSCLHDEAPSRMSDDVGEKRAAGLFLCFQFAIYA
jgi:hypothetical protein